MVYLIVSKFQKEVKLYSLLLNSDFVLTKTKIENIVAETNSLQKLCLLIPFPFSPFAEADIDYKTLRSYLYYNLPNENQFQKIEVKFEESLYKEKYLQIISDFDKEWIKTQGKIILYYTFICDGFLAKTEKVSIYISDGNGGIVPQITNNKNNNSNDDNIQLIYGGKA